MTPGIVFSGDRRAPRVSVDGYSIAGVVHDARVPWPRCSPGREPDPRGSRPGPRSEAGRAIISVSILRGGADEPRPVHRQDARVLPGRGLRPALQWAHFDDIPFTPLARSAGRSPSAAWALVTTSEMARPRARRPSSPTIPTTDVPVYSLPTDTPVEQLYSRKAAYDRYATTLDDVDSYLPLDPPPPLRRRGADRRAWRPASR